MTEEPDNIVLVYLRRIDAKIDRMADDIANLKIRMTSLEENVAALNRRFDTLEQRIDRIERRLDLVNA